jgi:hypothetical protein
VFHWSAAEPVNLSSSYNNARDRQPEIDWPADLPWYDLLVRVARAAPSASFERAEAILGTSH